MNTIDELKKIEKEAYKDVPYMCQMQHIEDMSDLADYCECRENDVRLLLGDDYYCIIADHDDYCEFVDFASMHGCWGLFRVMSWMKDVVKDKVIIMDARESTSYKLIKMAEKMELLQVLFDDKYKWGSEIMHDMKIRINNSKRKLNRSERRESDEERYRFNTVDNDGWSFDEKDDDYDDLPQKENFEDKSCRHEEFSVPIDSEYEVC